MSGSFSLPQHCENCPDLPLMLVGTKTDLESCRQVSGTAVQALLNRFGGSIKHQEISTKENMEEVRYIGGLCCSITGCG